MCVYDRILRYRHIFMLTNSSQIDDNICMVTKGKSKTERPNIKASCKLWARFESWMEDHGFQSLPEGLRAAMIKVTNFETESQQKIA